MKLNPKYVGPFPHIIPSFIQIAPPITNLLKTDKEGKPKLSQPLKWIMECQAAFEKLEHLFTGKPVLKHPDPNEPFVIQVKANDVAVGAVLLQKNNQGTLQPCAVENCPMLSTDGHSGKRFILCSGLSSPGDTF